MMIKIILKLHYLFCKYCNKRYYRYSGISSSVIFTPEYPGLVVMLSPQNISIGDHTIINRRAHLNAGNSTITIGKYCHIGQGLTVYGFNHKYENAKSIPYDEYTIDKKVVIDDFVWMGANVTIIPGVHIGEGAVVGAGTVVVKNIPPCAIVGGNPAVIIKYRDKIEFYKHKKSGNFY